MIEWIPDVPDRPADFTIDPDNYNRDELIAELQTHVDNGGITPKEAQDTLDFADVLSLAHAQGYRISRN